jgi:hypothetical protein
MDRQTIRHDPPVNQDSTGDVRENEASSAGVQGSAWAVGSARDGLFLAEDSRE